MAPEGTMNAACTPSISGTAGNSYSLPRLRQQQIRQPHPPFPPSSLPPAVVQTRNVRQSVLLDVSSIPYETFQLLDFIFFAT